MTRLGRWLISTLGAALLAGAAASAALADASIDIVDMPRPVASWTYAPKNAHVEPGAWVTWSNSGQDAHTVTANAGAFDSGALQPGEGFSWYFDQPGRYDYYCTFHDWMKGQVVVPEVALPTEPPMDASSEAPPLE